METRLSGSPLDTSVYFLPQDLGLSAGLMAQKQSFIEHLSIMDKVCLIASQEVTLMPVKSK